MSQALQQLADALSQLASSESYNFPYHIPSKWVSPTGDNGSEVQSVNPYRFYRDRVIGALAAQDNTPLVNSTGGEWSKYAVIYNMFVRQTTAWDHNGDGKLGLDNLEGGFRETGTFLKAIALLPYLKHMGINTIHLLPITSIGSDGNKGSLGSPYAIKNPYTLDHRLGEPCLPMDTETQFKAFVEAAHRFGMRVVVEFVFRTAAKDSDWIKEHPEWFYWIDAAVPDRDSANPTANGYGNPQFAPDVLKVIKKQVKDKNLTDLPAPPTEYLRLFKDTPNAVEYRNGKYIGTTTDGTEARIPGAFADWPPDDVQPPWGDVTYLKMYAHPDFNYIAYNTIRMYDTNLAVPENEQQELWESIIQVLPSYQERFGIDGVMIDMGHALPKELMQAIVTRAREGDPDFAFWEENFALTKKSREDGYNLTMGYLWSDEHESEKLKAFCKMLATKGSPIPFFATPETHNTKRAAMRDGGALYSRMALVINSALPGALFVHQGYELADMLPVNTGLGFTSEDLQKYPSVSLPLFSEASLAWTNGHSFSDFLATIIRIREQWKDVICNNEKDTFLYIDADSGIETGKETNEENTEVNPVLCYVRTSANGKSVLAVVANTDCEKLVESVLDIPGAGQTITDLITGKSWTKTSNGFLFSLQPGEVLLLNVKDG